MKRIGIIYNPKREEAISFSREMGKLLHKKGIQTWLCSAWEPEKAKNQLDGSDLIISVGGDGTILRAAKVIIPDIIPILGVNMGKLGFMTELNMEEAMNKLPSILNREGWIEDRAVLESELFSDKKKYYALNDVFVGRRSSARLVNIECRVDGDLLTSYRVDGLIVASASGSTGYALAAGGPILHPKARGIILQPVSSHFSFDKPMVLPPHSIIRLKVLTTHEAMISIDGQIELQLNSGDELEIKQADHVVRFLRFQAKNYFYKTLDEKLNRKVL